LIFKLAFKDFINLDKTRLTPNQEKIKSLLEFLKGNRLGEPETYSWKYNKK